MAEIEALAVQNHGENNPLSRLWDHWNPSQASGPAPDFTDQVAGSRTFVEGFGRRFSTESTRFGPSAA